MAKLVDLMVEVGGVKVSGVEVELYVGLVHQQGLGFRRNLLRLGTVQVRDWAGTHSRILSTRGEEDEDYSRTSEKRGWNFPIFRRFSFLFKCGFWPF